MRTRLAFMKTRLLALSILVLAPHGVMAFDGLAFSMGNADDEGARLLRISVMSDSELVDHPIGGWRLNNYWQGAVAAWDWDETGNGRDHLVDVGADAVLRLQKETAWVGTLTPFIEAGLGLHWLSQSELDELQLSSHYHFASQFGIGFAFGEKRDIDFSWHIQHLSNAGLKEPNPGINFSILKIGYRF